MPESAGQTYLQMPNIKQRQIAPGNAGEWTPDPNLLRDLKDYLDTPGNPSRNIESGVPTFWARPSIYEKMLFFKDHPRHGKIKNEWLGILAVIYFAKELQEQVQDFNLETSDFVFTDGNSKLNRGLRKLRPSSFDSKPIKMIYVNRILIAGEHPRTIFYSPPEFSDELRNYIPWFRSMKEEGNNVMSYMENFKNKHVISEANLRFFQEALTEKTANEYELSNGFEADIRRRILALPTR